MSIFLMKLILEASDIQNMFHYKLKFLQFNCQICTLKLKTMT